MIFSLVKLVYLFVFSVPLLVDQDVTQCNGAMALNVYRYKTFVIFKSVTFVIFLKIMESVGDDANSMKIRKFSKVTQVLSRMDPDGPRQTWTDPNGPGQTQKDLDRPRDLMGCKQFCQILELIAVEYTLAA